MQNTKEDSPWHREESVAIHTEMVCYEFEEMAAKLTMSHDTFIITYLSLLFHDTGKPPCKVVKFKPERGHYNAFHGHEMQSARLWEDYFVSNHKLFKDWLTVEDAYKVMWMIENHLPYDVMHNDKKMDYLRTAMAGNLGDSWQGFGYHLLSDTYGRISDDAKEKRAKTELFVDMMNSANVAEPRFTEGDAPTVSLLVGASGSGKSSSVGVMTIAGFKHYSFDDIRIELAKKKIPEIMAKAKSPADEYHKAWTYCDTHRSEFGHYADVEYIKLIKNYDSIVVDNTNVSRKSRTKFIVEAKKRGYNVEAVMFPVAKEQILSRQHSRTDKNVPDDAVLRQYNFISIPWVGVEVDSLRIVDSNLVKK
jgi:predicted kinase